MSYISEIFDRLDIQNLRSFLLNGVECCEISSKTYEQRLNEAQREIVKFIEKNFPEDSEKILNEIFLYGSSEKYVYMEIGLQCGIALASKSFNTR